MEIVIQDICSFTELRKIENCEPTYEECSICLGTQSKIMRIPDCSHSFCQGCISDYLQEKISGFKVLKIKCLQDGCQHQLKESFIQKVLDQTSFEKFQKLVIQKLNNRGSEIKVCPKPGCSKPFTPSKSAPFTQCKCNTQICNLCCEVWHEGKTCLEAIDPEFELYAKENEIKCCIICKTMVTRVEGCTHITCPVCDYEWCWLCGQEFNELHPATCKRVWNPKPPSSVKKPWEDTSCLKFLGKLLLGLLVWLVLLPFRVLFWPFYLFDAMVKILSPNFTRGEKLEIFLVSFLLNLFSVGSWACLVYLMIRYPGSSLPLGISLGISMFFPVFAKFLISLWESFAQSKRWKKNNLAFGYTDAHKPIENLKDKNSNENETHKPEGEEGEKAVAVSLKVIATFLESQENHSPKVKKSRIIPSKQTIPSLQVVVTVHDTNENHSPQLKKTRVITSTKIPSLQVVVLGN